MCGCSGSVGKKLVVGNSTPRQTAIRPVNMNVIGRSVSRPTTGSRGIIPVSARITSITTAATKLTRITG